jgi:hypothetical protein
MWEHHAGVKFISYKARILYQDDFLGIYELLKTQINTEEVNLGVKGLDEIIRKSDYRYQDEARGEETGACLRAITALVGARPEPSKKKPQFPFRSRGAP